MAIGDNKQAINEKRDAIKAAVTAAFSAGGAYTERVVTGSFLRLDDHSNEDLTKGVIILLIDGEGDYSNKLGMIGKEGTVDLLVVFHGRVTEDSAKSAIEDMEITFVEEFKAFCRSGVSGLSLLPQQFQFSKQRHHPYGFVAGRVSVTPPRNTQA